AIELGADAILVSQTVTQQNLHIANLTELVEIVEAEGRRKRLILACGGPRVSNELAKELGYDAGFSKGTYPHHVASFIVRELAAILAGHARAGVRVGVTSIGRDGEQHDVLDARISKPPVRLQAGALVASTGPLLRASAVPHERLVQTGIRTPLGEVVIARLRE